MIAGTPGTTRAKDGEKAPPVTNADTPLANTRVRAECGTIDECYVRDRLMD
jgi:hypothetical protein